MSLNQPFISDVSEYYRWSQRTKIKYKVHYGWCTGRRFYGRHTAQHQLHKKEGGSYYVVSANKASSVTL